MGYLRILIYLAIFMIMVPVVGANEKEYKLSEEIRCNEAIPDDLQKFSEAISLKIKKANLQDRWDNYLKECTHFNNQEYLQVISSLGAEFNQAMTKVNECAKKTYERENQYSSDWLRDFLKEFGEEYVSQNIGNIKFVITSFWMTQGSGRCDAFEKEAIYKQIFFKEAIRQYARNFIKFNETLEADKREKIKGLISNSQSIIDDPDCLLGRIIARPRVHQYLYSMALQSRKDIDPKLIEFFSNHPFFCKPFDAMRAIRDLKKFEKLNNETEPLSGAKRREAYG